MQSFFSGSALAHDRNIDAPFGTPNSGLAIRPLTPRNTCHCLQADNSHTKRADSGGVCGSSHGCISLSSVLQQLAFRIRPCLQHPCDPVALDPKYIPCMISVHGKQDLFAKYDYLIRTLGVSNKVSGTHYRGSTG